MSECDEKGRPVFDPKCIENLKHIIVATGADIVVTYDWKYIDSYKDLLEMWRQRGMLGFMIDTTPNVSNHRDNEIARWLNECKEDCNYVIIDDLGIANFIAEADRFIDTDTIIRRTIQYGLANYPQLDRAGHYQRTIEHLNEKCGPKGYLKVWIPWSDNAKNLKRLHVLLTDRKKLEEIFNRIFDEENE